MELFFTDSQFAVGGTQRPCIPFVLDERMELVTSVNEWLFNVAVISGRTRNKPLTWKAYGYRIVDFFSWLEARKLRWDIVNKKHISLYRDWSLERCEPGTVNTHLSAIALFYAFQVKQGSIERTPIDRVDLNSRTLNEPGRGRGKRRKKYDVTVRAPSPLPQHFAMDEMRLLLRAANDWEEQLQMAVWAMTGMRRAELAFIEFKAVQSLTKRLMSSDRQMLSLRLTNTKNGVPRDAFLTRGLASELHHWGMLIRPQRAELYRQLYGEDPSAFWLTAKGKLLNLSWLSTRISKIGQSVGVHANPHKFRHTFATDTYAATGDLRKVQKLLGHRSISSTETYEHTGDFDQKGSLERYQQGIDGILAAEVRRG